MADAKDDVIAMLEDRLAIALSLLPDDLRIAITVLPSRDQDRDLLRDDDYGYGMNINRVRNMLEAEAKRHRNPRRAA